MGKSEKGSVENDIVWYTIVDNTKQYYEISGIFENYQLVKSLFNNFSLSKVFSSGVVGVLFLNCDIK